MLSVISNPLEDALYKQQRSSEIDRVILRTSSSLSECQSDQIEEIIQQSLATVGAIELADHVGWFFFSESGSLTDTFRFSRSSFPSAFTHEEGLHRLPWCIAQLNSDNAVLINDVDNLCPAAEIDRQFLRAAKIHSLALIPSKSISIGQTVLILASTSSSTEWSYGITEQCTLLENIYSNAYSKTSSGSFSI
jgi:hypothetical protein